MHDVLTIGEILIDLVATQENVTLFEAAAFQPLPGGAPANVAVGVARLGKSAAFIGKVGGDDFGQGLRQVLVREKVDVTGLQVDPTTCTTLSLVALTTGGEPHFTFAPGAHTRLTQDEIPTTLLQSTRIVAIGSVALMHQPIGATVMFAVRQAQAAGALIAYDVNWRPALARTLTPDQALTLLRQPIPYATVVKMNEHELQLLSGTSELMVGLAHVAAMAPHALIVVTRGGKGCAAWLRGTIIEVPAPPVSQVVDATGAGDAFFAALLTSLPAQLADLDEASLPVMLRRATIAGALAVTKRGAIPSLPTSAEIDDFILADAQ